MAAAHLFLFFEADDVFFLNKVFGCQIFMLSKLGFIKYNLPIKCRPQNSKYGKSPIKTKDMWEQHLKTIEDSFKCGTTQMQEWEEISSKPFSINSKMPSKMILSS
jgi:hypothetical protein